jgi:hypothetical protein
MFSSKLPQTKSVLLAKASTNSEFAIGQKISMENSTPLEVRLSQAGCHTAYQAGFQAGSIAGFKSPAGCDTDSQG